MKQPWYIALWILLLAACGQEVDHRGRTPLVEVGGQFLYAEDLSQMMPAHVSRDDSVLFAEHCIRQWVEDALLLQNAERNVRDNAEVEQLVTAYRRSLILHLYQEQLMNEQLVEEIGHEQVDSFYQANSHLFLLDAPLVKGLYIKVPLKAKGVNNVRKWYTQSDGDNIEKLEKYSLQHAADYLYFYDRWIPLSSFIDKLPLAEKDPVGYIAKNPHLELTDTAFHHFLHVDSILLAGAQKPLDYAESEVREILLNMHRVDFMKQVRTQLYLDAQNHHRVKYHY